MTLPLSNTSDLAVDPLAEGPRASDDPLLSIVAIRRDALDSFYDDPNAWWRSPPTLMPPSTAKPLARSALVPLWDGLLPNAAIRGSFAAIGTSLPPGDPYVRRVAHHLATEIGANMDSDDRLPWPQITNTLWIPWTVHSVSLSPADGWGRESSADPSQVPAREAHAAPCTI